MSRELPQAHVKDESVGAGRDWWRDAVFYQVYPRSFAGTDPRKPTGDLPGVTSKLDALVELGVDALWLSPIFTSPQADHGYDVSNYTQVDPMFGTMADFNHLLKQAHALGLRVTIDLVPSHTSAEHEWFREAVASPPGSSLRDRYLFREGRGRAGDQPPTGAISTFGGPAWTRVVGNDGVAEQWYFHLFAPEQPDLNWANPEVLVEFERIWRFWLDKGVDGFRIDVADHLTKNIDRPWDKAGSGLLDHSPANRTHEVWRSLRDVLDSYQPPRMAVGEVWATGSDLDSYGRPDEFPLVFDFSFLLAGWDPTAVKTAIASGLDREQRIGTTPTWVMDNHDMVRSATRYADSPEVGLARSRAMSTVMLALPGAVFLYQGQDLGLPNVDDLPEESLQDPIWQRSGRTIRGRDGCRVPLPWIQAEPEFGFKPAGVPPWLPLPQSFADLAVDQQVADPDSTWRLCQQLLSLRRRHVAHNDAKFDWQPSPIGVLSFTVGNSHSRIHVLANFTNETHAFTGEVLVSSRAESPAGVLLPNSAFWLTGTA
jgi:alpha-glucosidase